MTEWPTASEPPILQKRSAIPPQSSPPTVAEPSRWKKHLLFGTVVVGVLGMVVANLNARPMRPSRTARVEQQTRPPQSVVEQVNQEFLEAAQHANVEVCGEADWLTICRRLNLALVGSGLSLEEIRQIEQIPESERIDYWVEHLLEDDRSSDYLAERFTRAFVGTNNGPFLLFRRRRFVLWLSDEIRKGTPYDRIVQQLIASDGLWTENPSVNFVTATMDENNNGRADPIRLAGRTCRAFLGMRIDCLQCHDDFLGNVKLGSEDDPVEGKQNNFHELAAFYSGAGLAKQNVFAGIRDDKRPYQVKFLGSEEETEVAPQVPYRPDLLPEDGKVRNRLARWVTHPENKAFARVTVNRTWALLFGKPLVVPVDDIPIQGPYPAGLESLSDSFIENHYNLRQLIRTMVSLEAFRRDSKSDRFDITPKHEEVYAAFPLTQLRPEQVASSIHQASRLKTIDANSAIVSQLEKFGYVNDFTKGFGDRGDDEFVAQAVTIPQRLLMMNGRLVNERTKHNPILNASSRIGALSQNDAQAIDTAFLATLNRLPSPEEREQLVEHIVGSKGDTRGQRMSDIYWMLVNSTEFLWNH